MTAHRASPDTERDRVRAANRAFDRYRRTGNPECLAELFDRTAAQLHRVARHLVGDEPTADDLVQVTFLVAIERSSNFERGRDVLPWLTGILRNQAALVHRRRQRRPDPERLTPIRTIDPASEAESAELVREVERSIAQLPPVYRPVLQLHVLHGLDARQISRTLERPGGTVRTQLVRGLQKLRELLPVSLAGLLAGLLPGTGLAAARQTVLREAATHAAHGTAVTATTSTSLIAGLFAMKKASVAVAALGLIALAGWFATNAWETPGDPGAAEDPSLRTAHAERTFSDGDIADSDGADRHTPAGTADSTPAAPVTELRGVVRDETGAGVDGATVLAWSRQSRPTSRGGDRFEPTPTSRTETSEQGHFAVRAPGEEFYLLALHDDRISPQGICGVRQGREVIAGLDLELAPTTLQEGRLLDAAGEPVSDFEFGTHLGSAFSPNDRLDQPGFRSKEPPHLRVVTDADGSFQVRALADHRYLWEVQHPEHPMLRQRHVPRDGFLQLRLEAGELLAGSVFRADGSAASGARIRLNDHPPRTAECDASGRFTLVGVRLRDGLFLRVDDPESAIHCVQPLPDDLQDIRVRLQPPRRLAGRVLDGSGGGVPDAEIRIVGDRRLDPGFVHAEQSTWEWAFDAHRQSTDAQGQFTYERLYDGEFEVQVRKPGAVDFLSVLSARAGTTNVEIRLDRVVAEGVTLAGTARDGLTGEPLTQLDVTVFRKGTGGTMMGRRRNIDTDAGAFRIEDLAPGEMQLLLSAPGRAPKRHPLQNYDGGVHRLDVTLFPRRSLEVIVKQRDGTPADGAVEVLDSSGQALALDVGPGTTTKSVRLQKGRARLSGLPAELVRVRYEVRGIDRPVERAIDLAARPLEPLVISLGDVPDVVDVPVGVLCCPADADLDAFSGPPGPEWLTLLRERADVWWLDEVARLELTTDEGTFLSRATLTPERTGSNAELGAYRAETRHFDGTSFRMIDPQPGPASAVLRGRRTPMILRLSAPGYTAIERPLRPGQLPAAGASPQPILLFLRRPQ